MNEAVDFEQEARLIDLVRQVGREEIMPRFRRLDEGTTRAKSAPDDLVTLADLAAENALREGIRRILPDAHIVGEEDASENPAILAGLGSAPISAVIDPIDGTWNYAHGIAVFGTILAILCRGETVWGLLYDPVIDDWVRARKGGGAWYGRAGADARRLEFDGPVSEAAVCFLPLNLFEARRRAALAAAMAEGRRTLSLRCSCHEYRTLLTGGAASILNAGAKPWDHAAGVLAVCEAGGIAEAPDGSPYAPSTAAAPFWVARDLPERDDVQKRFGSALRNDDSDLFTSSPQA